MEDQSTISVGQKAQDTKNENTTEQTKRKFPLGLFIKLFITFILLGGLGVGGFYGYKYIKKIDKDIASLKEQTRDNKILLSTTDDLAKSNNDRVNTLAAQIASGANNYVVQTPVYATTTIEKVIADKNSALEDGFRFLLLDVKLFNNSQNDVYFSTGDLKLKDSDNYEYSFYYQGQYGNDFVKKDAKVLFPDNRIPLSYTYIKPGETVNGTIVFVLNRPTATKFSLIRNGVVLKDIGL